MTMAINWTDVRYVLVYPALLTFGLAWCILMALRFRSCAAIEAAWAAAIGAGLAGMGLLGIIALWLAHEIGFVTITSFVFTLAVVVPAVVLAAGTVRLFVLQWRNGHK